MVQLKLYEVTVDGKHTPACMWAQCRYNRCVAWGELWAASRCLLSVPLPQSNTFLLVQMHSGLANTLKSESLKQPHLHTQLTHCLLISSYIIIFCTVCCSESVQDVWTPEKHMCLSPLHDTIKNTTYVHEDPHWLKGKQLGGGITLH